MSLSEAPIEDILKDLESELELETLRGTAADFVQSLKNYFFMNGFLTPAQEKALRNIHRQHFA